MPECHESTRLDPSQLNDPHPTRAPTEGQLGHTTTALLATVTAFPSHRTPRPALRPRFSIRLAEKAGAVCSICDEPTGSGPIGCCEGEPICDRCLIEGCHELGMVIALISIVRGIACLEPVNEDQEQAALGELREFAKIYEQIARRLGPPRPFPSPGREEPPP